MHTSFAPALLSRQLLVSCTRSKSPSGTPPGPVCAGIGSGRTLTRPLMATVRVAEHTGSWSKGTALMPCASTAQASGRVEARGGYP